MNRELDGIYFRVKRNEKYENICFSDLTEIERDEVCKDRPAEWYKKRCISSCREAERRWRYF